VTVRTTTSGTAAEPRPSTRHVITINGTAHPVRDVLTPGEQFVQRRQRATKSTARRRPATSSVTYYDIQRRPLPNIAEERL